MFNKMNTSSDMPVIGIAADRKLVDTLAFHAAGEKYLTAVIDGAGGFPLLIPSLAERISLQQVLDRVDGLLLTGSQSNVEPRHYGGTESAPGTLHDPQRDAMTLPLIHAAIDAAVPVLAICRGFQEVNVAFGGSLHQKVHEVAGFQDHREPADAPEDVQYGPSHPVAMVAGGQLAAISGVSRAEVNSLHSQGVDRLGDGLLVEARAPDGLVEAFRVADAAGFALAVQWHPEWRVMDDPLSMALFRAFGDACRERVQQRASGVEPDHE